MKRKRWTVLAVFAMVVALLPLSAVPAAASGISINEIRIDQPGTDNDEYFELSGLAGTSLDGLTYLVIGDGTGGSGVIEAVVDLTGQSIPTSGYFVAAESTFALGTADLTTSLNFENSDNVTHLLVAGFTGSNGDDLDTNDDGTLDVTPWSMVVDSVSLIETSSSGDRVYSATTVGPDGSFVPGQVYLCESWEIGAFDPDFGDDTPGAANDCPLPPPPPPAEVTKIHDIQGNGMDSPMVGAYVAIEGVMVGDFRTPDGLDGFFVQEEDVDADTDPLTSEGVFIYDPDGTVGSVGETVRVVGTVSEFRELTEIGADSVEVIGSAGTASAEEVLLPVDFLDEWEQYEGMLVTFPQDLYITEFYNFDRHNEILLGKERHYQPTNVMSPGPGAVDAAAAQELARITLDDGRLSQNPDPLRHPNGMDFDLTNYFRGGDVLRGVTGILNQRYDRFGSTSSSSNELQYRIDPTQGATYVPMNPRPEAPDATGGTIRVASFNVLNFFTTLADGSDFCGGYFNPFCRGANDATEYQRQLDKLVTGIIGLGADIVGLQEIENDVRSVPGVPSHDAILALVDALNDAEGGDVWAWGGAADYYNTYPVRNEIIYKKGKVVPVGPPTALEDVAFDAVRTLGADPVGRPPLAQTYMDGNDEVFTVVVNHFKSKGSFCGDVLDPDTGDVLWTDGASTTGQANCNLTRVKQAEALLEFVAQLQADTGDPDVLIVGDLNSYAKEDPVRVLTDGGFADLHQLFEGPLAYSYVFDGRLGYLDNALANPSMLSQVTGATTWHINADEVDLFDYNTSFLQEPQVAMFEGDKPYRVSDHDPVIVGLALGEISLDAFLTASPDTLWAANHKYVQVTVSAMVGGVPVPVVITSVNSSEDDSGYNKGDKPDDVGAIDGDSVMLRAERFTPEGRVYTIMVSAFGGRWTGTVDVVVPHDMGKRHNIK